MLQASISRARNSYCKNWDPSDPYLWAMTIGVGNKHNALCTSFVQKYTFHKKADIDIINWNLSKMQ